MRTKKVKLMGKEYAVVGKDPDGKYILDCGMKLDPQQIEMFGVKPGETPEAKERQEEVRPKKDKDPRKQSSKKETIEQLRKDAESKGVDGGATKKTSPDKGATEKKLKKKTKKERRHGAGSSKRKQKKKYKKASALTGKNTTKEKLKTPKPKKKDMHAEASAKIESRLDTLAEKKGKKRHTVKNIRSETRKGNLRNITDYKLRGWERIQKNKNVKAVVSPGRWGIGRAQKANPGKTIINAFDAGVGGTKLWSYTSTAAQKGKALKLTQGEDKIGNFIMNLEKIESIHGKDYTIGIGIDSKPKTTKSRTGKTRKVDPMVYGTHHNYNNFPFFKQALQSFYSTSMSKLGQSTMKGFGQTMIEEDFFKMLDEDFEPRGELDRKVLAYAKLAYHHIIDFIMNNKVKKRMSSTSLDDNYTQPWKTKGTPVMVDTGALVDAISLTVKREKKILMKIGGN